jgi:hypothetical protein
MPVVVTATPGSSTANSYITVAEGTDFADLVLGTTAWSTASADNRGRAVIAATTALDALDWVGSKATTTQALLWPRKDATCGEKDYADNVIPPELKRATFDLAEALLGDNDILTGGNAGLGELIPGIPNADLQSATVDVLSVTWKPAGSGAPTERNALTVLPHLRGLLGCLCLSSPSSTGRIVRSVRS